MFSNGEMVISEFISVVTNSLLLYLGRLYCCRKGQMHFRSRWRRCERWLRVPIARFGGRRRGGRRSNKIGRNWVRAKSTGTAFSLFCVDHPMGGLSTTAPFRGHQAMDLLFVLYAYREITECFCTLVAATWVRPFTGVSTHMCLHTVFLKRCMATSVSITIHIGAPENLVFIFGRTGIEMRNLVPCQMLFHSKCHGATRVIAGPRPVNFNLS